MSAVLDRGCVLLAWQHAAACTRRIASRHIRSHLITSHILLLSLPPFLFVPFASSYFHFHLRFCSGSSFVLLSASTSFKLQVLFSHSCASVFIRASDASFLPLSPFSSHLISFLSISRHLLCHVFLFSPTLSQSALISFLFFSVCHSAHTQSLLLLSFSIICTHIPTSPHFPQPLFISHHVI